MKHKEYKTEIECVRDCFGNRSITYLHRSGQLHSSEPLAKYLVTLYLQSSVCANIYIDSDIVCHRLHYRSSNVLSQSLSDQSFSGQNTLKYFLHLSRQISLNSSELRKRADKLFHRILVNLISCKALECRPTTLTAYDKFLII